MTNQPIISKPFSGTIASFSFFLIISFVLVAMSMLRIISGLDVPWYNYLAVGVLGPLSIIVIFKIFINYKIVKINNKKIEVNYKVMRRQFTYAPDDIVSWQESVVSTGKNSSFKELLILFNDNRKLRLGNKEYSRYQDIYAYFVRAAGSKKVEQE